MTIETTPDYWNCECDKDYIHPRHQQVCPKCGAHSDDSPNSRVDEVNDWYDG